MQLNIPLCEISLFSLILQYSLLSPPVIIATMCLLGGSTRRNALRDLRKTNGISESCINTFFPFILYLFSFQMLSVVKCPKVTMVSFLLQLEVVVNKICNAVCL